MKKTMRELKIIKITTIIMNQHMTEIPFEHLDSETSNDSVTTLEGG